jgi:hypothetical protein
MRVAYKKIMGRAAFSGPVRAGKKLHLLKRPEFTGRRGFVGSAREARSERVSEHTVLLSFLILQGVVEKPTLYVGDSSTPLVVW